jgi:hypothetical protein
MRWWVILVGSSIGPSVCIDTVYAQTLDLEAITAPIPGMTLRRSKLSEPPTATDLSCLDRAKSVPLAQKMWIINRVEFDGGSGIESATFNCGTHPQGEHFTVRPIGRPDAAAQTASEVAKSAWGMEPASVRAAVAECVSRLQPNGEKIFHKMTTCGVGGSGLFVSVLPPAPFGRSANAHGDQVMTCEATLQKGMKLAPGQRPDPSSWGMRGQCIEAEFSCPSRVTWHDKAGPSVEFTTKCKYEVSKTLRQQMSSTIQAIAGRSTAVAPFIDDCILKARAASKSDASMPPPITVGSHLVKCDTLGDESGVFFSAEPKLD